MNDDPTFVSSNVNPSDESAPTLAERSPSPLSPIERAVKIYQILLLEVKLKEHLATLEPGLKALLLDHVEAKVEEMPGEDCLMDLYAEAEANWVLAGCPPLPEREALLFRLDFLFGNNLVC